MRTCLRSMRRFPSTVHLPSTDTSARFSSVDKETGKYLQPASASLIYGTLTWVRSTIVQQAGIVLARGAVIAVRYCAVRRQFQDRDAEQWEKGENQVLNYKMVQIRLLSNLAASFALHFTGKVMMGQYNDNQKKMQSDAGKPKNTSRGAGPEETHSGSDLLADLHATSCGLKSLASTLAAEGLEVCRRACGGHGYSSFSGIGPYYADYLPTTTWEGDNYMLTQQVARYVSVNCPPYTIASKALLTSSPATQVRTFSARRRAALKRHNPRPGHFPETPRQRGRFRRARE